MIFFSKPQRICPVERSSNVLELKYQDEATKEELL